jgi:hypothetical protein
VDNADVFAVITPTEVDVRDEELRLSGGITPRRGADDDEERPGRLMAKGTAVAGDGKTKEVRISRSPPRRRVQDITINKDKGSRKSVLTRSPTKKEREVCYRYGCMRPAHARPLLLQA